MDEQMQQRFMQMLGMGGGLGTAGAGLYGMFNQGKNPATQANNTLGQIPGQMKPYYQPYMDAGKGAMSDLQNQYKDLLSGNTQNQLGQNFKEGPGYQYALKEAMNAQGNASARGGMLGTPQDQAEAARVGEGLAGQEYDKYMQNQMGLYGQGLTGEQGINQMGYDANTSYGNMLGSVLGQQSANQFAGQAGQNTARSQGIGNLFSGLGMAAGSMLGGPAGGAAGKMGMDFIKKLFGG
jgi:hypothetical protein